MKAPSYRPHATEAEQGVLGCIMLSPKDCFSECLEKIKPNAEAFYEIRHQTLYRILAEMHAEKPDGINLITVLQKLKDKGKKVGGRGRQSICSLTP